MGNAPSVAELPPEWDDILPHLTREDVIRSSRKRCRIADGEVYLDNEPFDLDEHVPKALAILRAHPHLKTVRFKLVPGWMTEERFWAALFGILNDGGIDIEDIVGNIDDDYETGDEVDESMDIVDESTATPQAAQSPNAQSGKSKPRSPIAKLGMYEPVVEDMHIISSSL